MMVNDPNFWKVAGVENLPPNLVNLQWHGLSKIGLLQNTYDAGNPVKRYVKLEDVFELGLKAVRQGEGKLQWLDLLAGLGLLVGTKEEEKLIFYKLPSHVRELKYLNRPLIAQIPDLIMGAAWEKEVCTVTYVFMVDTTTSTPTKVNVYPWLWGNVYRDSDTMGTVCWGRAQRPNPQPSTIRQIEAGFFDSGFNMDLVADRLLVKWIRGDEDGLVLPNPYPLKRDHCENISLKSRTIQEWIADAEDE